MTHHRAAVSLVAAVPMCRRRHVALERAFPGPVFEGSVRGAVEAPSGASLSLWVSRPALRAAEAGRAFVRPMLSLESKGWGLARWWT